MNRLLRVISLVAISVLLSSAVALAQLSTAQLSGRVADESGAVLPGVTVTVTQTDTGLTRSVVTDENGAYVLPNLPTGPYRLEAMLQGFRTYSQTGIVLQVAATPVLNVVLGIGISQKPCRWRRRRRSLTCRAPASATWWTTSGSWSCRCKAGR